MVHYSGNFIPVEILLFSQQERAKNSLVLSKWYNSIPFLFSRQKKRKFFTGIAAQIVNEKEKVKKNYNSNATPIQRCLQY